MATIEHPVITQWKTDLLSSKFKQGKGRLTSGVIYVSHCCLGVLAESLASEKSAPWRTKRILDKLLAEKAGLCTGAGVFNRLSLPTNLRRRVNYIHKKANYALSKETSLAHINDMGGTFKLIHDIIDYGPEGLFFEREN